MNDEPVVRITGLTPTEMEMLDHMWSLDTYEEFRTWQACLDEDDYNMSERLQRMLLLELSEAVMDKVVARSNCTEANEVLKQFRL